MQRTTLVSVGLLFVLGIAFALAAGRGGRAAPPEPTTLSVISSTTDTAPEAPSTAESAAPPEPTPEPALDAPVGFDRLPDGQAVPELPASAPKSVRFGVVLFTYRGAQGAPDDAPSKEVAKRRAESIVEQARTDFASAVAKGDFGSTADAGRVPRGVLEPAVEYVLFTLEKGAVHPEPIDTPRGYWVVRRSE
ncbi:MAG: hypothetical protein DIU78_023350 [Pseudomonadota bacterium]